MIASNQRKIFPALPVLVSFLLLSGVCPFRLSGFGDARRRAADYQSLRPQKELRRLNKIKTHLRKINKPSFKTIQTLHGEVIDCVLLHQQPAFDHPLLRGQKPLDPPERPRSRELTVTGMVFVDDFRLWRNTGESCPEGTMPIRRTSEEDILRASSLQKFGRKAGRCVGRDFLSYDGHDVSAVCCSFPIAEDASEEMGAVIIDGSCHCGRTTSTIR